MTKIARAFPFLTFFTGATLSAVTESAIESWALTLPQISLALTLSGITALGFAIHGLIAPLGTKTEQLLDRVDGIGHKIGLRVRYIEREVEQAILFREARRVIEQAQRSIVVVNTFLPERNLPDADEISTRERRLFYESILKQVTEKRISYKRIVQIERMESLSEMLNDPDYLYHFHMMLDERDRRPSQIGLIKGKPNRPLTFVLVDDEWLILQMNERLASTGRMHMHGIFIFEDPQRTITQFFCKFYQAIELDSLGAFQRSDLPAMPRMGRQPLNPTETEISTAPSQSQENTR